MRVFAAMAVLLALAFPCRASDRFSEPRNCETPTLASPVCFAQRQWNEGDAAAALGTRDVAGIAEGDVLSVIARRDSGPVTLCCSINAPLNRIADSDLWVLSVRVLGLDRGIIDLELSPSSENLSAFFGAHVSRPAGQGHRLLGTLIDDTIQSEALGEPRKLTIYLPPGHRDTAREPVVYMADGEVVSAYAPAIEAAIIAGHIRPIIVVGIWPGMRDPGERSREYLIGRSTPRYRGQDASLVSEVMPYVENKYGASNKPQERMIAGISDGAGWALSMGLRHPDLFGTIASMSLGWIASADGIASDTRPRLYLSAGYLEPGFHRITAQTARRAQESTAPLRFEEFASAHVLVAWQTMLVDALCWTFPRGGGP